MAQDDHVIAAWLVFFWQERAAKLWLYAEQWKEVGRDELAIYPFRVACTRQVKAQVGHRRHACEDLVLITPVQIVGRRWRISRVTPFGVVLPDHHKAVRVFIRQGA